MHTLPCNIRHFLSLALLLLAGLSVQAQMLDDHAKFGLKLGVNGTNLYDDANAQNRDGRIGLTGGVFVKMPLGSSHFSLRPELLLATKGANYQLDSFTSSLKFAYIELPLSLEYNLSILNLHAGLNASFLANSKGEFKDEQGNPVEFDKSTLEKLDYGWHAGLGIDLGNLGIHFRIARGLKGVGKSQSVNDYLGDLKNSAWTLSLAYGFGK
ncbi:MAG: PorT family protein [Saprospiraceae bacterium]|nr:PorT family protein [Saprospiraceae bacterium]